MESKLLSYSWAVPLYDFISCGSILLYCSIFSWLLRTLVSKISSSLFLCYSRRRQKNKKSIVKYASALHLPDSMPVSWLGLALASTHAHIHMHKTHEQPGKKQACGVSVGVCMPVEGSERGRQGAYHILCFVQVIDYYVFSFFVFL